MHYPIYMVLRALVVTLSAATTHPSVVYTSNACGGADLPSDAEYSVLQGEACENECYKQDFEPACTVECDLQDCHDYGCDEWRCVADCTDAHKTACLNGCSSEGTLFRDSTYIVSGEDVDTCVDFLCSKNISVDGASCN